MTDPRSNHVADRIQAYLDGEVSPAEAESIRDHCSRCAICGRDLAESAGLRDLIRSDPAPLPARSVWPGVRECILPTARPRFGPLFAFGASAAVLVGLLFGIAVGSMRPPASSGESEDIWSAVGSTMTGGERDGLGDVYFMSLESNGS